jgi:hypothetical protein
MSGSIFSKPPTLHSISSALLATFHLDPSSAALLLRAQAGFAGGEVTAAAALGDSDQQPPPDNASSIAAAAGAAKVRAAAGHPLLPRMPLSLEYLTSMESYQAAAGLARALGRAARLADSQQQAAVAAGKGQTDFLLLCTHVQPGLCAARCALQRGALQ